MCERHVHYCMYILIVDISYINHTVLEGYDSFVFLVSFLADAIKLNNV